MAEKKVSTLLTFKSKERRNGKGIHTEKSKVAPLKFIYTLGIMPGTSKYK